MKGANSAVEQKLQRCLHRGEEFSAWAVGKMVLMEKWTVNCHLNSKLSILVALYLTRVLANQLTAILTTHRKKACVKSKFSWFWYYLTNWKILRWYMSWIIYACLDFSLFSYLKNQKKQKNIHPLRHTYTYRCLWLASVVMIGRRERAYHPSPSKSTASFAALTSNHGWLWHHQELNLQSPDTWLSVLKMLNGLAPSVLGQFVYKKQ